MGWDVVAELDNLGTQTRQCCNQAALSHCASMNPKTQKYDRDDKSKTNSRNQPRNRPEEWPAFLAAIELRAFTAKGETRKASTVAKDRFRTLAPSSSKLT